MAVLSFDEIVKLIKSKEPDFIHKAKKEATKLSILINGDGTPEYLEKVEGYENETQFKLRKKFSGTTKHVFQNLSRPIDKVFTARGGSKIYGTSSETAQMVLKDKLSSVRGGKSISQWIKTVQLNKYYTDPSGFVFFEWEDDETYPTVKSIHDVKSYIHSGRSLEYVLFVGEHRKDEQGRQLRGTYYRLVDDAFDYTIFQDGENVSIVEEETFDNPWGKVPAIINSEIINHDLLYFDSPFSVVADLGDKYLRGQSTRNIYEQLHMYPVFWMYAQKCESCKGSGTGSNGDACKTCNGTKQSMKKDVSDALLLSTPKNSDSPTIAPNVAGYVAPELETFRESREELEWLGRMMTFSIWGSTHETAENNTATAAFLDLQPVNDRQGQFSDAIEDLEKKMTDFIGEFYLQTAYDADSTSINYGRIYLMQPPEKLLENYRDAREKGSPDSLLDHLYKQYIQSEFMNDPQSLGVSLKAMGLEPFLHKSVEEVQGMKVANTDYYTKVYFNDWWVNVDEDEKRIKTKEQLRSERDNFINTKLESNEDSQDIQTEATEEES